MIVTLTSPKGINYWINKLQPYLESQLFPKWAGGLASGDPSYRFYPRVFRNQDPGAGYIAELYTGDGNYREVFWDDSLSGLSWFGLGPKLVQDVQQVADVHLVTFANLKTLYPAALHRADEEIRNDFQDVFKTSPFGFIHLSTEIWLQNVLREYPGSRRENRLIGADMGFVHAFRLNLQLRYNPLDGCDI
jgi:hypothetical protein